MKLIKKIARRLLKSLPQSRILCNILRSLGIPDKISQYLNFKGKYRVKLYDDEVSFYSHGSVMDNRLFWRGIFSVENMTLRVWAELCRFNNEILDVGANIGIFSVVAKAINPNARIYGFEPIPGTAEILRKNASVNDFDIKVFDCALGNKNESTEIFLDPTDNLTASMNKGFRGKSVKIQLRKFDDISAAEGIANPTLIKIDVETFEPEVLKGMEKLLTNKPTIIVEILEDRVGEEVETLLSGKGYEFYYIDENKGMKKADRLRRIGKSRNYLVCLKEVAEKVDKSFFQAETIAAEA